MILQLHLRLARQIRELPAGSLHRLNLATSLANLSTEDDFGRKTLEEVATTLASALRDKAIPRNPKGEPDSPPISHWPRLPAMKVFR